MPVDRVRLPDRRLQFYENSMKTYIIIVKENGSTLCEKRHLKRHLKIEPNAVIEYEFKAPNIDVARIVTDVHMGFIEDLDKFLHDLADYCGYKLIEK